MLINRALLSSRCLARTQLRHFSSSAAFRAPPPQASPPIFQLRNSTIFEPYSSNSSSPAWFNSLSFTIESTPEQCWAILSSSSSITKTHLVDAILSNCRFSPRESASYPILESLPKVKHEGLDGRMERDRSVDDLIKIVGFKMRLAGSGSGFVDYSARYYHIRDEDKITLREHLVKTRSDVRRSGQVEEGTDEILEMAKLLQLERFLEAPLVTLSNGQTRRARILKALLSYPEMLILEEPFTGLDVPSRELLSNLLATLHSKSSPRIFLVLRPQDELPSFVSHLALVGAAPGEVTFGTKDKILQNDRAKKLLEEGRVEREKSVALKAKRAEALRVDETKEKLIELKKVNISYGEKRVLLDVDWTIRAGEKWVLSGDNGSGKSTLLSLVLGDHPMSFTEDITVFGGIPRAKMATATLQSHIGHASPEIYNAFPRNYGRNSLTAQDTIFTGFDSVFSYRPPTASQTAQFTTLLSSFAHPLLTPAFLSQPFSSLSPGSQSLLLLLRALVARPKLLVLDEPFSGMDKETVDVVKRFLNNGLEKDQALVLISHFEEEVPECVERSIRLVQGKRVE